MNEQQQASELARWLEQPAGTPPPEGLDPDVVEAIYAVHPDRAPALTLTADDILADFGDFGHLADASPTSMPPSVQAQPDRPGAANRPLLPANRIAGFGVLLAAAATLLLVALPVLDGAGPTSSDEVATPTEIASSRSAATPDPYVGGGELTEAQQAQLKDGAVDDRAAVAAQLEAGDALADADFDAPDGERADYAAEQRPRFAGEGLIPEVAAAPAAPPPTLAAPLSDQGNAADFTQDNTAGEWADADAVAMLDEEAPEERVAAEEAALYAEPEMMQDDDAVVAERSAPDSRKSTARKKNKSNDSAPSAPAAQTDVIRGYAVDSPNRVDDIVNTAAPPVSRSSAVPRDVDSSWRNSVDASSLSAIDGALQVAEAEATGGNPAAAAASVSAYIQPPAASGQYLASKAARWYLDAGDPKAAASTARRGLALGSGNTAYRSQLLVTYGDALSALGDTSGAQSAWNQAAGLNVSR